MNADKEIMHIMPMLLLVFMKLMLFNSNTNKYKSELCQTTLHPNTLSKCTYIQIIIYHVVSAQNRKSLLTFNHSYINIWFDLVCRNVLAVWHDVPF